MSDSSNAPKSAVTIVDLLRQQRFVCTTPEDFAGVLGLADEMFLTSLNSADRWYGRAVLLSPTVANPRSNRCVFLQFSGQLDSAREAGRQAVSLDPSLAEAYLALSEVLFEFGHAESALRYLRRASCLNPASSVILANLGFRLLYLGEFAEGWRHHEMRALGADFESSRGNKRDSEYFLQGMVVVRE